MPKLLHKFRVPLIGIELPEVSLPDIPPKPLKLDERKAEIVRHAIADDLADLVPIAGDFVSDTSYAEIRRQMTPEEYEKFLNDNKALPSTLAALKVFAEEKG